MKPSGRHGGFLKIFFILTEILTVWHIFVGGEKAQVIHSIPIRNEPELDAEISSVECKTISKNDACMEEAEKL